MQVIPMMFNPTKIRDDQDPRMLESTRAALDMCMKSEEVMNFRRFFTAENFEEIKSYLPLDSEQLFDIATNILPEIFSTFENCSPEMAERLVKLNLSEKTVENAIREVERRNTERIENNKRLNALGAANTHAKTPFIPAVLPVRDEFQDMLDVIGTIYAEIGKELFVKSMHLNYTNFKTIFPSQFCQHDMEYTLKLMEDPNYQMSAEEIDAHFAKNRSQSFSLMSCMSMFDVAENVVDPDMRVLMSAGRYQTLKARYDAAAEKMLENDQPQPPAPRLKLGKSLDNVSL